MTSLVVSENAHGVLLCKMATTVRAASRFFTRANA